jgi:hypothetical protein
MARENSGWGYDRIVGALANLGHHVSDQTVGNVLRRHGIQLAPQRSLNTTWRELIESHLSVLAGIDFFAVEVAWRGLGTYCVVLHPPGEPARLLGGGSRGIWTRPGWSKWRATRRAKAGETWSAGDKRCAIGTRSSAIRFERR